jgi:hypothetical protein
MARCAGLDIGCVEVLRSRITSDEGVPVVPYNSTDEPHKANYAISLANDSYNWYRTAAVRARRNFRLSETVLLLVSAAIPVAAVLRSDDARVPAVLGGVVVILTGLRSLFHWQEDYVRFNQAREAVEAERRRYQTGSVPYADNSTRDRILAAEITRIEQQEMGAWIQLMGPSSEAGNGSNDK